MRSCNSLLYGSVGRISPMGKLAHQDFLLRHPAECSQSCGLGNLLALAFQVASTRQGYTTAWCLGVDCSTPDTVHRQLET